MKLLKERDVIEKGHQETGDLLYEARGMECCNKGKAWKKRVEVLGGEYLPRKGCNSKKRALS